MDISLIYTNWRRKDNLKKILSESKKQFPSKIIVVDNSSQDENKFKSNDSEILIIESDNSLKCWKRWLVSFEYPTKYVCIMDDDICFSRENVIEDCFNYMEKNKDVDCVGPEGVIIVKGREYFENEHLFSAQSKDIIVDIVKGRFMFIRSSSLEGLDMKPDLTCDDIKVSSHLKKKVLPSFLYNSFYDLPQGSESLSRRHYQPLKRDYAVKSYFKSKN